MLSRSEITEYAEKVLEQVRKAVVGKDEVLFWVLATVLARGHILIEDIPGVGKTTLALAFSRALGLAHNRVQFTPDVLPSDVTGYSVLEQTTGQMTYRPGAVLCNLFLADELNRATSRTQSALLEAMEEDQVTVDGVTHPLPSPFVVIATQNPAGAAGTQLLPDSQIDRFTVCLRLGYPDFDDEVHMVRDRGGKNPLEDITCVMDTQTLCALRQEVAQTYISDEVIGYTVSLMEATRNEPRLLRGASPRATLAVVSMAKAIAAMEGRDYVVPEDVRRVLPATVCHRLIVSREALLKGATAQTVLNELLASVTPPKLKA